MVKLPSTPNAEYCIAIDHRLIESSRIKKVSPQVMCIILQINAEEHSTFGFLEI
jgi:hypothetical protein